MAIAVAVVIACKGVGYPRRVTTLVVGASFALPTTALDLAGGKTTALVLLLLVLAWRSLERNHDTLAGTYLGLATALRLFPIAFLIPLLRLRKTRALRAQVVTSGLAMVLGATILGWGSTSRWANDIVPLNTYYWRGASHNISLSAVPFRWLVPSTWRPEAVDLPLVAGLLSLALVGLCVAGAWVTPARRSRDLFWATIPWVLLASPLAWADDLVLIYPLILLTLSRGVSNTSILGALSSAIVILGRPVFMQVIHPTTVAAQVAGFSLPMYGLLGLSIAEFSRPKRNKRVHTPTPDCDKPDTGHGPSRMAFPRYPKGC